MEIEGSELRKAIKSVVVMSVLYVPLAIIEAEWIKFRFKEFWSSGWDKFMICGQSRTFEKNFQLSARCYACFLETSPKWIHFPLPRRVKRLQKRRKARLLTECCLAYGYSLRRLETNYSNATGFSFIRACEMQLQCEGMSKTTKRRIQKYNTDILCCSAING